MEQYDGAEARRDEPARAMEAALGDAALHVTRYKIVTEAAPSAESDRKEAEQRTARHRERVVRFARGYLVKLDQYEP